MADDSTAEKAQTRAYNEITRADYTPESIQAAIEKLWNTAVASRDAKVAAKDNGIEDAQNRLRDLRYDNDKLREQLAEAKRDVTSMKQGYDNAVHKMNQERFAKRDALKSLAEAQATIAKVRAYAEDRAFHAKGHLNTVNSGRIASDLLAILPAPSSTGGGNDWVDPEPWWYPNSHMRTGHKLPQTTAEYHPRTREQWEAEEGNDHE